jgi:Flp pilus assembly protein protease CpaA
MLELLLAFIAVAGGLAAGMYDLKTSNIPDVLCIVMIIAGLGMHSYYGLTTGDFSSLQSALLYGGLFLAFGLGMYFTGQWGGGDGELLVAIGVLVPTLSFAHTFFPFALSFFINSFFIGAVYSIAYSAILAIRSPGMCKGFVKSMSSPYIIFSSTALIVMSLISLAVFTRMLSLLFFLSFTMIVLWKFAKSMDNGFYKRIPTSKLRVDDMIGEDIPKLRIYKRLIKGLTKEQVVKIRKMKRYVMVKEGVRYGLVFPLTLIFTIIVGDIFLLFV